MSMDCLVLKLPEEVLKWLRRTCSRCGYTWYAKVDNKGCVKEPINCANKKCKSKYWWDE